MDRRLKQEFEREDFRMRRLRMRAYGLRMNKTAAEEKIYDYLIPAYQFQVAIFDYIVDFLNPDLKVVVEIDGGYHLRQPRKDNNRMVLLHELFGICTIRFRNDEILADVERCVKQIREFERNPIVPVKLEETEEERQQKEKRRLDLIEIHKRVDLFESQMLGKTRQEVLQEFEALQPIDELDEEVILRIKEKVNYWPDEGYISPGLQRFTADKLKIKPQ